MEDDSFVPTACPAPDLDDSRITRVADVVEHVYSGACPVQFGASDSVLVPEAVAHLRGKVIGPDGAGLSGVHVRILGRSDFGWTRSRAGAGDLGTWDLVVNGGGPLVVELSKPGYLTVQRRVEPIRNDYLVLDDVVLLPQQDGNDCAHVSGATGDFYLGPVMTDARGSRRLGMYFPSGSTMTITDASSSTVTDYCICSVEYTADRTGGATGQRAMPGALPTTSAYTYAAELQLRPFDPMAGTCDDAPIPEPTFSAPIFAYVLDHDQSAGTTFVGFGVGTAVPSGYYDEEAAAWVAEPDGRVVQIVDNGSGGCAFDVTGDGVADSSIDGVAAHHVTAAELAAFASHCGAGLEYSIGDRLWRIPVYHFSPADWNWAVAFLGGALLPFLEWAGDGSVNDGCSLPGSIIGCEEQTLGEVVPISGTPWALHYQSERQRGRRAAYELEIPFRGRILDSGSPCSLPTDCAAGETCTADGQCAIVPRRVGIEIQVAGRRFTDTASYGSGSYLFTGWDGTDAWGRLLQGAQPVTVRLGYFYDAEYVEPPVECSDGMDNDGDGQIDWPADSGCTAAADRTEGAGSAGRTFGMPPGGSVSLAPAGEVAFWATWRGLIGGWDQGSVSGRPRGQGLGGWSVSPHHVYDARAGMLYRGDGSYLMTRGLQPTIDTIYDGAPSPPTEATGIAVAPDGTIYFAAANQHAIYRLRSDGTAALFAGIPGSTGGTNSTRLTSTFSAPNDLAIMRSGDVLVLEKDANRLRRIRGDEVTSVDLSTVGGLSSPRGIALGPDETVYIADHFNNRIVAWEPASGRAFVFAQHGTDLYRPLAIAVDDAGRVYAAISGVSGSRIQRVLPSAMGGTRILTVAGGGSCPSVPACPDTRDVGDGGRATDACLTDPRAMATGRDGSIYVAEWTGRRVRRVAPDGVIETFAGRGQSATDCSFPIGDGGPATSARLYGPIDVVVAPDGRLLIGDSSIYRIREVRPALPDAVVGESIVAEPDGSLVYRFDQWGRHVRTEHGITGATLVTFSYHGTTGWLTEVQSPLGGNITIPRSMSTYLPIRIESAFGQQTVLSFDAAGYLQAITDPESRAHTMTYFGTAPGLLDTFATADGATWSYGFDRGRLIRDTAPSSTGVEQTLTRSVCGDAGYTCDGDVTSGWGVAHNFTGSTWADRTYDVWRIGDSVLRRRQTLPSGARAVSEIGDLDGTLPGPAGAAVPVTQRALTTDGTLVEAATGADPRPGLGDMVQAIRATWPCPGGTCAPSPHQANVRVARTISPTDAATLYDVDQMTDAITVNATRTTTISMLRTTTSGCEQQWTIQSPLGTTSQVCADALGRPRSVTAPGFHDVTIDYDSATGGVQTVTQLGRQTRVLYQDATMAPQPWASEVRRATGPSSYLDRVRLTRDGAGWITQAIYNGDGAGTRTLGIDNDLRGRPRFLTLPNAQVHEHQYTALDVLSAYLPPDVTTTAPGGDLVMPASTDPADRPLELRVMNGMTPVDTLGYIYDGAHGHLSQINLPASSPTRSIVIQRDTTTAPDMDWVDGRVTSLALDGNTTTYTYEGPFLDVETWEGAVAGSVDRDVDAFGELSAISVDDVGPTPGVTLTYLHDADGRLTAAGDLTVGYTLYGSGTSQHWRRNSALPAGGGPLNLDERLNRYGELDYVQLCHGVCFSSQTKYTYSVTNRDVAGREVAHTDTVYGEAGGGLFGPSTTGTFTYYYTGTRLWKVTRTVSSSFGSTTTTVAEYTYDANGNRLTATYSGYWADASRPNVTTPATHDAQDRLITYGGCSYTYNAAGQLATRTCGAGTDTFEYDLLGNLLSVELANGNVVEYEVDALGRRIRRRLLDGAAVLEEQRWLYLDGLNPVAELDETNTLRRVFVYGTRANVPDYVIDVATGARYRIAAEPRGTVRAVIDESGAIVQRMRYDAFGFVLEDVAATGFDRLPFGFAGGIYDRATGLTRFGARDYDPVTGRWTAKDPLLFGGAQTNLFSYADGDPVNHVDPTGTVWIWVAVPFIEPFVPLIAGAMSGAIGGAAGELLSQLLAAYAAGCSSGESGLFSLVDWGAVGQAGLYGAAFGVAFAGASGLTSAAFSGAEWRLTNNFRLAPFGNRTGHSTGRWPHYHRRAGASPPPGQGIGRHRPWDTSPVDTSWWDRF